MTAGRQAGQIVVRVAHGALPEGDLQAAVASLDLWLERESTGEGSAERRLGGAERRRQTKSGELFTELCYRIAEGVAVEALYATVRAAVTAWRRHWRQTRGAAQEVEVEVEVGQVEPGRPDEAAEPPDGSATDQV